MADHTIMIGANLTIGSPSQTLSSESNLANAHSQDWALLVDSAGDRDS